MCQLQTEGTTGLMRSIRNISLKVNKFNSNLSLLECLIEIKRILIDNYFLVHTTTNYLTNYYYYYYIFINHRSIEGSFNEVKTKFIFYLFLIN